MCLIPLTIAIFFTNDQCIIFMRCISLKVSNEWPGLPMGVKFDPSDVELLEHLAAKCGVGNEKPHQFTDEFIPTLDVDEGICYKHPEDLPGELSFIFHIIIITSG